MQNIVILGATGSIGSSTLQVIQKNRDDFGLTGFSFGRNVARAAEICRQFSPNWVFGHSESDLGALRGEFPDIEFFFDATELDRRVADGAVSRVVAAVAGFAGLQSTYAAIDAGQTLLLANKESLVAAGALLMPLAKARGATLLPIDSEHNALFQCLQGQAEQSVQSMTLTASGGALRDWPVAEMAAASVAQALAHPNWSMGPKVTIDSATMMNKVLELIEAHWLFGLPSEALKVLIHPQSIVHALVSFEDGSTLAQLGYPDMRTPIAHALAYPLRMASGVAPLDLSDQPLEFKPADPLRYPLLALADAVLQRGGNAGLVLNAANEVAVGAFIEGKIRFSQMLALIERSFLGFALGEAPQSLEDVVRTDRAVREHTINLLRQYA